GGDNEFLAIIIIQELASVRCKLPVHKYEDIIVTSVVNNNVTILVGDTGSGKTTQVPQYLYKYRNKITNKQFREVITQPRRVAATTVASRVAEEMGTILGEGVVGYAVRFDDNTNHRTRIKFCTDGILLREAVVDPTLSRYTVVIIDEIHERSLYTDTVLGLVSNALVDVKLRDNIKVVLMSATVVADKFKEYFLQSGCSVNTVVVPGRTYPVALYYTPTPEVDFLEAAQLTIIQILLGIEDDNLIHGRSRRDGDILVFLPDTVVRVKINRRKPLYHQELMKLR
ncbi:ATP-dependent RNA helicase, putative, partial [Perkinsus marinus ATCC 50983]